MVRQGVIPVLFMVGLTLACVERHELVIQPASMAGRESQEAYRVVDSYVLRTYMPSVARVKFRSMHGWKHDGLAR